MRLLPPGRISGYTESEAIAQVCDGHEIGVEDLLKYQHPTPEKTSADTIKSLALEDPQHPPLYYLMARFWVQWFGSSVAVTRSLSALISLLVFPCTYWLCLELFNSSLTGWVAIALIAVTPFHVLYAQEAREYTPEPLENYLKELQQVVRDAELGQRFVDKLVQVWRRSGEQRWVLLPNHYKITYLLLGIFLASLASWRFVNYQQASFIGI